MVIKNMELEGYCRVFDKLLNSSKISDVKTQYNIFKACKSLRAEMIILNEFRKNLEDKYFVVDNGIVRMDENNQYPVMKDGMELIDYVSDLNRLMTQIIHIDFPKIDITFDMLQPLVDDGLLVAKDFAVLENFMPNLKEEEE